ncbi:MAG: NIPSNAP family protein [Anaerolinea sp.]|nr:NIPSNAP family protein [Anaerolinea sp.]
MKKLVEIRSYNLKEGSRNEFHRLVLEKSLPLLKQWRVDVVAFGPSPHDSTSYYLIRAYDNLAERQSSQDAFYSSLDWRQGPRESIVSLIESDTSIVIEMESSVVDVLRQGI